MLELFKHCIPDKDDKLIISAIFYKPLAGFIASGGDRIAQAKAAYILHKFMAHLIDEDYFDLANFLAPKIIALYIKSSCTDFEFTDCLRLILDQLGVKYFITTLNETVFSQGFKGYSSLPTIVAKQVEILE